MSFYPYSCWVNVGSVGSLWNEWAIMQGRMWYLGFHIVVAFFRGAADSDQKPMESTHALILMMLPSRLGFWFGRQLLAIEVSAVLGYGCWKAAKWPGRISKSQWGTVYVLRIFIKGDISCLICGFYARWWNLDYVAVCYSLRTAGVLVLHVSNLVPRKCGGQVAGVEAESRDLAVDLTWLFAITCVLLVYWCCMPGTR